MPGSESSLALLRGLRRAHDEAQLTQALASTFAAEEELAVDFLRLALSNVGMRDAELPKRFRVSSEEVSVAGRFDLRFRAEPDWDIVVELKIHAGYGRGQLTRYLGALSDVRHAYVLAITRDVPLYGEPSPGFDARWLGSVRWRALLAGLRELRPDNPALHLQWPLFLDVLELEGSMGFTRPDPELFSAWASMRVASAHVEKFVEAVRHPVLNALRDALGGAETSADFYRGRGGRPVLSRSKWGKADIPMRVPADGAIRVRAGMFGWNPPARFYVTPDNGRRWVARMMTLPSEGQQAVRTLIDKGFRASDLQAFFDLDETRLRSPTLEQDVVEWTHARFVEIVDSGLLSLPSPGGRESEDDAPVE